MTGECDSVGGVSQENSQQEESLADQPSPTVETSKLDVAQPTTEVEVAKIEKVSSSESPKGPKSRQAVERGPVQQPSASITQVDSGSLDRLLATCCLMLINLAKLTLEVKDVQDSMAPLSSSRKKRRPRRANEPPSLD